MPRSLAEGHTKFIILTTKPANPEAPTAAELADGIDASCAIVASDFTWGATDSDKVQEKALCEENNVNSLGASNYSGGFTLFRYFDATNTGQSDAIADAAFAACKVKGTELWCYARRTAKKATEAIAAQDEIFLGAHVLTDTPQPPSETTGYIKSRIPVEIQDAYDNISVAA